MRSRRSSPHSASRSPVAGATHRGSLPRPEPGNSERRREYRARRQHWLVHRWNRCQIPLSEELDRHASQTSETLCVAMKSDASASAHYGSYSLGLPWLITQLHDSDGRARRGRHGRSGDVSSSMLRGRSVGRGRAAGGSGTGWSSWCHRDGSRGVPCCSPGGDIVSVDHFTGFLPVADVSRRAGPSVGVVVKGLFAGRCLGRDVRSPRCRFSVCLPFFGRAPAGAGVCGCPSVTSGVVGHGCGVGARWWGRGPRCAYCCACAVAAVSGGAVVVGAASAGGSGRCGGCAVGGGGVFGGVACVCGSGGSGGCSAGCVEGRSKQICGG